VNSLRLRPEGPRAAQAAADSPAPLLQLPHVDMEAVKRLGRKRVRALADLAALAPDERVAQLTAAGAPPLAHARSGRKPDAPRVAARSSRAAHIWAAPGAVPRLFAQPRGRRLSGRSGWPGALASARKAGQAPVAGADRGAPRGRPDGCAGGGGRDRAERRAEHQRERRGAPCAVLSDLSALPGCSATQAWGSSRRLVPSNGWTRVLLQPGAELGSRQQGGALYQGAASPVPCMPAGRVAPAL